MDSFGIYLILGIIGTGLLIYLLQQIIFEIPEWSRSSKLSRLARENGLSFLRAKKGWLNGWLSFDASEKNFITGSVGNIAINFNDFRIRHYGATAFFNDLTKYSKLNGVESKRLSIDDLKTKLGIN